MHGGCGHPPSPQVLNHEGIIVSLHLLLNSVFQKVQDLNPEALVPLHDHEGKVLRIQASDSPFSMTFKVQDTRLSLAGPDVKADATLAGKTVDLTLAFLKRETGPHALMAHRLTVEGDPGLLQAFHLTVQHLPPDLEGIVEQFTGDIVATSLSLSANRTWESIKSFLVERADDFSQYATYEQEWLVAPEAFEQFKEDLNALRKDVERLQWRLSLKGEDVDAN